MSTTRQACGREPALGRGRRGRAVGAVAAALATTAGSHLLSTGAAPPLIGLLLAAAAMAVPAWWLAGGERGWERLAVAQFVAQFGGHAVFAVTDPAGHTGLPEFGADLVLLAHVTGAVVAAAWLRWGERRAVVATRRAAAALWRVVTALLSEPPRAAPGQGQTRRATAGPRCVAASRLRYSIVHRGPPAIC